MSEQPPPLGSVDNALRLLLILERDGVVQVSSVATELGVARSTAHRLLGTLREYGFVVQDPHRRYALGPAARGLGSRADPMLAETARPHLVALARALGETVNLQVLEGTTIRFLDSVEGDKVLRVGCRTGVTLPAERSSGGRVLLAELPPAKIEELFAPPDRRAGELTDIQARLSAVRRRGYGTNLEETEAGVLAVAVAVRDSHAVVRAALSVSVPTVRYKRTQLVELLPWLRATAERLRSELAVVP